MRGSWKNRRAIRLGVAVLVVGALAYSEIDRRRRAAEKVPKLPFEEKVVEGPAELAKRHQDPTEFRKFCEKVNEKYLAMNARYQALQHRRRQRSQQIDQSGKVVVDEDLVEIIDFPGGKQRHRTLQQTDRLTGKEIVGESDLQKSIAVARAPFFYPFTPESKWDDFEYRFGGVELLEGKPVVKVEYVPTKPFGRKMAGTIWADAESGQPIRYAGRWHEPSVGVDHFTMAVRYGLSENGHPQMRRVETDGAGGLFFLTRHYIISFDVDDYRPPELP